MNHSNLTLAYIAGIFDGEGSLGYFSSGDGKKQGRRFTMEVKMTDYSTIELLHETFGGQFRPRKPAKEHYKPQWIWRVVGERAIETYSILHSYLRLKKLPSIPTELKVKYENGPN